MQSKLKRAQLGSPTVGALVLDVGHSTLRAGHAGEGVPSLVCPSVIGVGDDYDVFPLCTNCQSRYPKVDFIKYSDSDTSPVFFNGNAYLRAVCGAFGSDRLSDRRLLQSMKVAKGHLNLYDVPLLCGGHWNTRDCWDEFNCNLMYQHKRPIRDLDSLTILNVVNTLSRYTSLSMGMEEYARSRPLMIVESNETCQQNRILQCEQFFENLQLPGIFFGHGSQLAAYSCGLTSSIIIDVGSATTSLCVLIDDDVFAYKEYKVGGDLVDLILLKLAGTLDDESYRQLTRHPDYLLSQRCFPAVRKNSTALANALMNRKFATSVEAEVFHLLDGLRGFKESVLRVARPFTVDPVSGGITNMSPGRSGGGVGTGTLVTAASVSSSSSSATTTSSSLGHVGTSKSQRHGDQNQNQLQQKQQRQSGNAQHNHNTRAHATRVASPSNRKSAVSPRTTASTTATATTAGFTLPDNVPLDIKGIPFPDNVLALASEVLFDPSNVAQYHNVNLDSFGGIADACHDLIKSNSVYRADIYSQILVVGGAANAMGFQERLACDFSKISPMLPGETAWGGTKFRFVSFPSRAERRHASWIGGSILSSLPSFHSCWITLQEYQEHGVNICYRKSSRTFVGPIQS